MITPRTRRFAGIAGVVIALLLVGRWTASFVVERWWAATISPAAASFDSDWHLLGVALDLSAILLASIWFVINALLVARAIASVQVAHRFGDLQLREAVPTRLLLGGAAAAGVLLGLIAGTGAHAWREPIMLAWQGVSYGVRDPFLNQDLGVYVAQLPAWLLAHRFLLLLGMLGFAFCLSLYTGIGAVRREGRTIIVHPDARQHLGGLLAFIAVVIALGYLLEPYNIVAGATPLATAASIGLRIHASQLMTGVAVATTILTLLWIFRGQNRVLAAGWIVLGVFAAGVWIVMPLATMDATMTPAGQATAKQFDRLAWGIRDAPALPADSVPSVTSTWDEGMLAAVAARGGTTLEAATPTRLAGSSPRLAWLMATSLTDDAAPLDLLAVAVDSIGPGGAPLFLRESGDRRPGRQPWRRIADARTRPDAAAWRSTDAGVSATGALRRLVLAWARQAPGMLTSAAGVAVDWHLDPATRAATLLPMFDWLPPDIAVVDSRAVWMVQGMLPIDRFPLATDATWASAHVGGVVPVVVAVIDVATGETHFYLDRGADSLGMAWARVIGPLIAPAQALPTALRDAQQYPVAWFEAQLAVLQGETWNARHRLSRMASDGAGASVWLAGRFAARQAALEDPAHSGIDELVTAYRNAGLPQLQLEQQAPDAAPSSSHTELRQRWSRSPAAMHLRDSATAAGDTVTWRNIRWQLRDGTLAAWQPMFTLPRRGAPSLLWIGTALGGRVGGGRTAVDAWRSVATTDTGGVTEPPAGVVLDQARRWLQRADSAFRRGDLTAFGRAFEELRKTLAPDKP